MAKNSIADYSATAASNTDIQSVDIDEGCAPSGINNAIRELMADLADMNTGTTVLTSPSASALTLADGSSSAPALANTGDTNTGIFFPAADTVGVAVGGTEVWRYGSNPTTAKNLIINGAMTVAQRGGTMSLGSGGTTTYLPVDRFKISEGGGAARFDVSRDTSVVPSGFAYSLKVDCTTADGTIEGNDLAVIAQGIEAQNLQHLLYGTAGAKTLACTFRVRSPKTGTHYVGLTQLDTERYYLRSYTVDVADTWETKTVTFPGDASGVINSDTGEGLRLFFALHGRGGNFGGGTADAWTAWPAGVIQYMASDGVNVLDNAANNFYLAGVQLEVGSVATDFEHEPYSVTLEKCKRYYAKETYGSLDSIAVGFAENTSTGRYHYSWAPEMRTDPTFTFSAAGTFDHCRQGAAVNNLTASSLGTVSPTAAQFVAGSGGTTTAGEALILRTDSGDTATIERSAEL